MVVRFPFNFLYVLQVEMSGLTGKIKFDQHGVRTEFTLQIVELKKHGLEKVSEEVKILPEIMNHISTLRLAPGMTTLVFTSQGILQKLIQKLWKVFKTKPWW